MKFPLPARYRSVASLAVAVSLLLTSASAQRPATKPAPKSTPTQAVATSTAAERGPAATFDTLLSADAYGIYAELRAVGHNIISPEMDDLIEPLSRGGDTPAELLRLYAFLKDHAEPLMTARLMFAAMPVRAGLPEALVAVEMPSVEEARKLVPELNKFIAANIAPQPTAQATVTNATGAPAGTRNRRRGRRRAAREAQATTTTAAEDASGEEATSRPRPAAAAAPPPVQVKRSGSVIAMSNTAFTFKSLRGGDRPLLVNDPGFQAARTRFSTDTLFVYFNTVRMTSSEKQQRELREKEWRRQEELAQTERGKMDAAAKPDIEIEQSLNADGNTNKSYEAVGDSRNGNSSNTNVPMTPEDESLIALAKPSGVETPEATPTPKSEKELEEERQREQSQRFAQAMGSLVLGEGPGSSASAWPESIGVGVSLEGDALVVRGLFVNLADEPSRPIPFLPVLLSGPAIASEATAVMPAGTDIFVSASLDLPQMYDYLASMMKILDLAGKGQDENVDVKDRDSRGFTEQLSSFEKTNNFRIREELIAALGNEIAFGLPGQWFLPGGMSATAQRSGENPGAPPAPSGPIVVVALNDKKALQELLPRVLAAVGFAGASEKSIIEKYGEVEVLTFSSGTLAFIDRFLVGTPDAATMRRVADAYNSGETLANSERFRDATNWESKQAIGQIYVSNALLKGMFDDVIKSVGDVDDAVIRAFLLQLNPDPGAITHLATRESDGLMHEIHVPKNLLSLFTGSQLISQQLAEQRGNEFSAQWKMRLINDAQNNYKQATGRYGTIEELRAAKHISAEDDPMEVSGYEIKLTLSGDKFEATATPTGYPKQGRRSFYIDHTGNLRGGDLQGKPATTADPNIP